MKIYLLIQIKQETWKVNNLKFDYLAGYLLLSTTWGAESLTSPHAWQN